MKQEKTDQSLPPNCSRRWFTVEWSAWPDGTNQGGAAGRTGKVRPSLEISALTELSKDQRLWSTIGAAAFCLLLGCLWDISNTPAETSVPRIAWVLVGVFTLASVFSVFKSVQYSVRRKRVILGLASDLRRPFWDRFGDRVLSYIPYKKEREKDDEFEI